MTDEIPQHPPTYWGLVERRAAESPDRPLLSDEQGRVVTCREYRDEAERVAAGLYDLGVREGTVVSWQLPTTIDSLELPMSAGPVACRAALLDAMLSLGGGAVKPRAGPAILSRP